MNSAKSTHWDSVYATRAATEVSWYEARPGQSLELIRSSAVSCDDPIIDVGGGASLLVDALLDAGYRDLTVLDISGNVLERLRERLGARGSSVSLIREDVAAFQPDRRYAVWHDRAVFHFLVTKEERALYVHALRRALRPSGHVIMATFGPEGPEHCSGLPTARYEADTLAAELGPDFLLATSEVVLHRTPRNMPQQFLYCRFDRHG
jgi:hypothetical protein